MEECFKIRKLDYIPVFGWANYIGRRNNSLDSLVAEGRVFTEEYRKVKEEFTSRIINLGLYNATLLTLALICYNPS